MDDVCSCGSGQSYQICCQKYHIGHEYPPTPSLLMRARYSAFCRGLVDFLDQSDVIVWGKTSHDRDLSTQELKSVQWIRLDVLEESNTLGNEGINDEFVTFEAIRIGEGSTVEVLAERSRFKWIRGSWIYWDGTTRVTTLKVGRNEVCPCGSTIKWKRCCGQKSK